ncbi:hypothetical protein T01_5201 [Trichinella spiralis]|uniref:Uncharacterized protein n=1 Tax=Trichinella spiralis TaxID=6334 RepID=A0A0V0Z1A4_TRISP|nr:hypothetical protein T01_5201 [Trichinella spiralis]
MIVLSFNPSQEELEVFSVMGHGVVKFVDLFIRVSFGVLVL